jgi:hypothetical protein
MELFLYIEKPKELAPSDTPKAFLHQFQVLKEEAIKQSYNLSDIQRVK